MSFAEREEIALLRAQDVGGREIARRLRRSPSTISRELQRNAATRGGRLEYRAATAQWKAELMARRPKAAKLVESDRLRDCVADRLAGVIQRPDGTPASGPVTPEWKGRNKPRRRSPVGYRVEPGADRPPAADRLPRGCGRADLP